MARLHLARLGAGAFLAVSRGSPRRDAGILHVRYDRAAPRAARPLALVGKGFCFDTGGTNLKATSTCWTCTPTWPAAPLRSPRWWRSRARAIRDRWTRWLAITENNIGPDAYRPQDVVSAMNGTTIQVIHTDAEGRMVLADTLALASRSRPARSSTSRPSRAPALAP